MSSADIARRGLLTLAAGGMASFGVASAQAAPALGVRNRTLSSATFGTVGDGIADDTGALQAAIDDAFQSHDPAVLQIPPGVYKVTRTLRVTPRAEQGKPANITRQSGISAGGARILSRVTNGEPVIRLASEGTVRFLLLEGLDIQGNGKEGHGLSLECDQFGKYLYNFCLRDVVVQGCGGDGCRMIGNIFEAQLINAYFRDNRGTGLTMGHGKTGGILSAIHAFGCVFGQNGEFGAAIINNAYDVGFHGCYFLLNRAFGLVAGNGCTLLSHCGFENNHEGAPDFARGDAGMKLQGFATLVGCTAYSMFKQTLLLRAFVAGRLTMIGCTGSGGGGAKAAGLARLSGTSGANAILVGCNGTVTYADGFEGLEVGGPEGGIRFGADWRSRNLPKLGEYRLWVSRDGKLRMKKGSPAADDDGSPVGSG